MSTLVLVRGLTGTGKSTLVDHVTSRNDLNMRKLEIDEIKKRKYGNTTECNPQVDFREAGREARGLLVEGYGVAVEEAFCSMEHIGYFLSGAKVSVSDRELLIVRLKCSIKTAVQRKKEQLDPQTIRQQYGRSFENIEGEMVFDSEKCHPEQIADAVAERIVHIQHTRHKARKNRDSAHYY